MDPERPVLAKDYTDLANSCDLEGDTGDVQGASRQEHPSSV
jgi:hypothetical protein